MSSTPIVKHVGVGDWGMGSVPKDASFHGLTGVRTTGKSGSFESVTTHQLTASQVTLQFPQLSIMSCQVLPGIALAAAFSGKYLQLPTSASCDPFSFANSADPLVVSMVPFDVKSLAFIVSNISTAAHPITLGAEVEVYNATSSLWEAAPGTFVQADPSTITPNVADSNAQSILVLDAPIPALQKFRLKFKGNGIASGFSTTDWFTLHIVANLV